MGFPVFVDPSSIVPFGAASIMVIGSLGSQGGSRLKLQLQLQHADRFSTWKLHDPIDTDLHDPRRMTRISCSHQLALFP